ncbi:hypothetical protein A8709_32915 [Paenibacillus pectinilyticus]|uniref:Uncharacterized protein n=1 Tax=Paenibacillus pectinilyticus TaxID=512399 RepID=A0A1C0ZWX3_9BACL|nr:RusA family crossover junction endodeoxyribonuclease [Paenibacillus pectinilyticus]OCT12614.1 hypothetical protein A8709_32915 [Paenibacillus pectinilyticus]
MIQFTVYGPPVAQGRPRAGKTHSGDVVMYDPGKSKDYKRYVSLVASQNKPSQLIESAVSLTVKVYRPIPDSWSKVKQRQALEGAMRPKSKPDLSNYIKGIEDAIEGILLKNDSQVVDYGKSGKWYSDRPRIEIEVEEIG